MNNLITYNVLLIKRKKNACFYSFLRSNCALLAPTCEFLINFSKIYFQIEIICITEEFGSVSLNESFSSYYYHVVITDVHDVLSDYPAR